MQAILAVTIPFFALVLCGYLAARRGVLPEAAIPGLNTFVLFFALPCLLYRFGASTPVTQLLDPAGVAVWLACALLVVAGTVKSSMNARIRWNDAAFGALVAAFPNTGFMGVPLLATLLGSQAAAPAIISMIFDMVVTSSLCIALSRLDSAGESGARHALGQAFRGMVINPLPWSILFGALASAMRFTLPGPLDVTVGMLADAASPAALFTIGAVLARSALLTDERRAPVGDVLPVVAAKLLLHPLLVYGLGRTTIAMGLPLSDAALTVIVLVAALPSASNVSMLAERFGADNGRIARIILWTTVAAFVTFPLAVRWLV